MKQKTTFLKAALGLLILLIVGVTSVVHARLVTPLRSVSVPWVSQNIGQVSQKGGFSSSGTTLTVWGAGKDIWYSADQFQYVSHPLIGNGQLVAHVMSQSATDGWAKAGIMLRATSADNAANVFLALTPQYGATFQWREASGSETNHQSDPGIKVPSWLKLVRQNEIITGFVSQDGSMWTKVSSISLKLPTTLSIGLAVTAHNNAKVSHVTFASVLQILSPTPTPTPIPPTPTPTPTPIPPTPTPTPTPIPPTPTPTPIPLPPSDSAARVYGQGGSFSTATANNSGLSATSLSAPVGEALDNSGNLYVADSSNNRVLYYPVGSITATRVYGQGNSLSSNVSNNGGVSAISLSAPAGVALDNSGNLYIVDQGNSRVLYYPAGSTTATRVYGQGGDFTSNVSDNGGISADTLSGPTMALPDSSGGLYIADYYNQRVLYYPAGSTTAARVYGRGGDFTSQNSSSAISASTIDDTAGMALDGSGNLYIADIGNNRVLFYPAGSTTATRVYGQGNSFTSRNVNNGGISADSLNRPYGVALDGSGNLYVADLGNNRVLFYPADSTTATRVYGQGGDFTTNTANNGGISATSLSSPLGVALDGSGNLYISDSANNRVLMFLHT